LVSSSGFGEGGQMIDVRGAFFQEISAGKRLVLMPVSRFTIEKPFRIDQFAFYPAGSVDLALLRTVPGHVLARTGIEAVQGQQLREVQSNLTGASPEVLNMHAIVAFPYEIDWEEFLNADHRYDIDLLRRLSEYADRAMDIIKLHFCTLSVPYAIPGRVGTWGESGECLCALLYNLPDNESYLIAGRGVVSRIVAGLGLELNAAQCVCPMSLPVAGEVGNIARHGLMLFSDLMDSNTDTVKFARAMTLLEYLASPDEYKPWKKIKGEIISHLATTDSEYHALCERFRELTSKEDSSGVQIGLRTLVVHHGRQLEGPLPRQSDRAALFSELWRYCYSVLYDMVEMAHLTREELKQHRRGLRSAIGLIDPPNE
jgi:hypothetical protein